MAKTKILVPKVAEFFEDKVAGQRVDEALIRLTEELPNLKAADVAEVAGVPAASVGSSGVFFQTFETPVETTWTRRTDPTSYSYTANGQAGGKALNATGEVAWEFPGNIPFNDDRLYRIRARFRMTAAPSDSAKDLVYVGVQGFAANGTTLVDRNGTTTATDAHWYCAAGVDMGGLSLNTWYTYTGYFQGWGTPNAAASTDADAPRAMHSSVRYIRPTFRLNAVGGNGTMELDYISLEVLTEGTEGNQLMKDAVNLGTGKIATNKVVEGSVTTGSITADKIGASAVTTDKLDANAVTAAKIAAGTITATEIAANTITAAKIASGTITATEIAATTITAAKLASLSGAGLTINFGATGTQTVLGHTNFTILADGTATFSGNLSAAGGTFAGDLKADSILIRNAAGTVRGEINCATSGQLDFEDSASARQAYVASGVFGVDNELRMGTGARLYWLGTPEIDGPTLPTTAGASAGKYWRIDINGTIYKIALLADT